MALSFFEIRKKTDLFQSWGLYWVFQISWHIECSTLLALSFRIWNSTAGTASTPLALFVVMLPKSHLTSHSRISGSRWVSHHKTFFSVFFFLFFTIFYFTILYWFCHTSTWIRHGCSRVPNPEPPFHFPPHTISLCHPSAPAPSILYPASNLDLWFVSYMILYMFQCHSPNHPTLSLSHRVQKTVLYICVSFAVLHTGLSLPSF